MHKGTIVLVPFPFTDLSGHKVRPALVLHAPRKGEDIIVAFITSLSSKKRDYTVELKPSHLNGIKAFSTIRLDKLATLESKVVVGELGTLEPLYLKNIDATLSKVFDL